MLSTQIAILVAGFAIGGAFVGLIFSLRAVRFAKLAEKYAQDAMDWVRENNEESLGLTKIAEHEAALTELQDSYSALLSSHKKLRSRIGMRENRAKAKSNGVDEAASYAERKAQLRDHAKAKGYL